MKHATLTRLPGCATDGTLPARRAAWWCLVVALAVPFAAGCSGGRAAGEPLYIDGVVAQVGDEIVLASEVEEQLAILASAPGDPGFEPRPGKRRDPRSDHR